LHLRRSDRKMDALSLLLYGGASAVLYLAFVRLFPLTRYALRPRLYDLMKLARRSKQGIILYALCILTMFWLYWQAWHFVRRNAQDKDASSRLLLVFIVGSALLFALILVWMYPINANDLFRYFFRGRIFSVYGGNPLVDPPNRFYTDPYLYTVGEWIDHRSPYGPVWELLAAGVSWLTRGMLIPNLLALKGISVLCYGGSICLVYDTLGRTLPAQKFGGTLLFAWNPLILLEWIGNGHNDVVMLFFILLGVNLWVRKRYIWVLPALVMAVLVKMIAAIVVPFFVLDIWIREPHLGTRLRWLVLTVLLSAAIGVLLYAPFGLPWQNVRGIWNEATVQFGFSLPTTLLLIVHDWVIPSVSRSYALSRETQVALYRYAYGVPRWLALAGLAFLYLRQFSMVWRKKQSPIAASMETFFAYLILAPSFRMWYPAWSMALAPLCPNRDRLLRVGTICLTAELSVLIYGQMREWGSLTGHVLGTTFTQVLPILLPILSGWICLGQRSGGIYGHPSRASG
jgi:alpha-1,6-mannosyltransferase